MANRLFRVSANTLGLRYCENDGRRLSACLATHYGFDVIEPEPRYGTILEAFAGFLDGCAKTDTAIVHFSGHGVRLGGRLFFQLTDDSSKHASRIDLNQLVRDFQDCAAGHRLVILDCCHASHAAKIAWPEHSDRYLVLVASRTGDTAREAEDLEGGLLTTFLVDLLANPPHSAIADDGQIHIRGLFPDLHQRTKDYLAAHPQGAGDSLPDLIGNETIRIPIGAPPTSHPAKVLSLIREFRGANLAKLKAQCPELTESQFNAALDKLKSEGRVVVAYNIPTIIA